MYNKCASCGKLLDDKEERRIVLNEDGKVITKCMNCFDKSVVRKMQ
jgi:hypothetical protein